MPDDQNPQIKVLFSPALKQYICQFMGYAKVHYRGQGNLIPRIEWALEAVLTKPNGDVRRIGPHFGIGGIDRNSLTEELVVKMDKIDVALLLPEELKSADRLEFDLTAADRIVVK